MTGSARFDDAAGRAGVPAGEPPSRTSTRTSVTPSTRSSAWRTSRARVGVSVGERSSVRRTRPAVEVAISRTFSAVSTSAPLRGSRTRESADSIRSCREDILVEWNRDVDSRREPAFMPELACTPGLSLRTKALPCQFWHGALAIACYQHLRYSVLEAAIRYQVKAISSAAFRLCFVRNRGKSSRRLQSGRALHP